MEQAGQLKSKGIQEVACVSVNDAFVMAAWGKEHGTDGKVSSGRNQVIYTGLLEGPSLTHAKPSGPTLVLILHFQCCNIVPEIWTYCKLVANSFAYCDFFIFDELLMKFFLIHR